MNKRSLELVAHRSSKSLILWGNVAEAWSHQWTLTWFVVHHVQSYNLVLIMLSPGGANEAVIRMLISIGKYVKIVYTLGLPSE